MTDLEEPTLNIPSILLGGVIAFFVLRYFLSSRSAESSSSGGRRRGIDPAHVEQIAQMFPQLSRRDIMWDLQRNGGSLQATTERVLTGRGLESAPQSFQPYIPPPSTPANTSRPPAPVSYTKPVQKDLISRYNLASRVAEDGGEVTVETSSPAPAPSAGWSQNKSERQAILQKRRDEMILAARRKMQEKDKAVTGSAAS